MSGGCCLDCHFEWEERLAAQAFPPGDYRALISEHQTLRAREKAGNLPKREILAHAARERPLFERYAPSSLRELDRQHEEIDQGLAGLADPTAITRVGLGLATRSLVIGLGLMAAGMRGRDVVKYGISGSLAVEAFVLWWVWANGPKKQGEPK
jgi:hypothetical protein